MILDLLDKPNYILFTIYLYIVKKLQTSLKRTKHPGIR